jgi:hypothetical protein
MVLVIGHRGIGFGDPEKINWPQMNAKNANVRNAWRLAPYHLAGERVALIIISTSGPVLAVEAASSRLKRQDGASTTQRTISARAETMIDAERVFRLNSLTICVNLRLFAAKLLFLG